MAVVLVLLGGVIGFASGTATLIFTDLGLLAALGIWTSVGLAATLLALVVALLPPRNPNAKGRPRDRPPQFQSSGQ